MPRDVIVLVHYEPDRSMRIVVPGPDGPVDVGRTRVTAEVGRLARTGVQAVFGSGPGSLGIVVRVDQPPWLRQGMAVRLGPRAVDPNEDISHPYARIVGFLPVGGVMVVHPEAGSGVYPAEFLTPVDPSEVPSDVTQD